MSYWHYLQKTGDLIDPEGKMAGAGYSGHGAGLNNPSMEAVHGVGPLPVGRWHIGPWEASHGHLGPVVAALMPVGFNPHDRSAFFIHGDNLAMNHTASDGCLILSRALRELIRDSHISDLLVT